MMAKKSTTKRTTNQPREVSSDFIQKCIIEGYIHHYDFEFNMKGYQYSPIELGIATYSMHSNQEIDSFHIIINCKPPKPFPQACLDTHGISEEVVYSSNNNYQDICLQILQYLDKFQDKPSIWVLKDEIVSGDKKCLDFLFKNANMTSNLKYKKIQHITHHKLLQEWMKINNITVPYDKNLINRLYKNTTKTVEKKCDYHKTIDLEYHCALEDSRNTAIAIYFTMNQFKPFSFALEIPLENIQMASTEFTLDSKAVVFSTKGYQYETPYNKKTYGAIREVCCSVIDLQTGIVEKRQSFIFSNDEPWKLKDHEDKRVILDIFRQKQLSNVQISQQIIALLADVARENKIVVVGKSFDLKMITHFPINKYTSFNFDGFINELQKKLGEKYHLENVNKNLFKIFKQNAEVITEKECQLHNKYHLESKCAVEENYTCMGYVQYFIEQFESIYEQFNDVEIKETTLSPIHSNSVTPDLSPRISYSPSPATSEDDISPSPSPRNRNSNNVNNGVPQPVPMRPNIQPTQPVNPIPSIVPMNQPQPIAKPSIIPMNQNVQPTQPVNQVPNIVPMNQPQPIARPSIIPMNQNVQPTPIPMTMPMKPNVQPMQPSQPVNPMPIPNIPPMNQPQPIRPLQGIQPMNL